MTLSPGTRLGPYEVIAQIGIGGMGEVYRATDTNLKRSVAIKVLPASVAADAERLARFQREAEVLAALNHSNIAHIYGLEKSSGVHALVMELVDGEDLSQRIARGPVPLNEALPIARQIAEALEAAHEQGIIHRDLKPANIKVTLDGVVKVLDFGLAKLAHPEPPARHSDLTASPTITSPAMMTGAAMLLGTAAYMSPEQAKGREADKRSDVWAFGCVLYEMLTGKRPFDGDDVTDVLVAVLGKEPADLNALPSDVPVPIRTLLRRCLDKDRRKRAGDIAVALLLIDEVAALVVATPTVSIWRRLGIYSGLALIVGFAIAGGSVWFLMRPPPPPVVRTTITTSGSAALAVGGLDSDVVMTPDGSRVVYRGNNQLLVRALNQLEPTLLSGLGSAPRGPFISPDGQWVGFFDSSGVLKKVAITGGPPVTLTAPVGGSRGATWGEDGTIVFATNSPETGLQRVSAAGGDPVAITKPDRQRGEGGHRWPEFLPEGKSVLFTIVPINLALESAQIAVLDLQTGKFKVLIRGGSHAHYVPTGHLIYGVAGGLRAVRFDLRRLEVTGTPVPILEGVVSTNTGAVDVAVAGNGSLVYVPGVAGGGARLSIVSIDREGHVSPLPGVPVDAYRDVRVSPDGARLALATQDDVWIYDRSRATLSRLTTDRAPDTRPLWTPDGQRIVFTSTRAGYPQIFWRPSDGTGRDELLLTRGKDLADLRANGWSADGRELLFGEVSPGITRCVIAQIAIERPSDAKVLVNNDFCNDFSAVSPDGHWIAYHSNVSGRYEIFVERYPELGDRQQISTDGGWRPVWSPDGKELFFSTPDNRQMLAVPVQFGTTLNAGRPRTLFEFTTVPPGGGTRHYDVAPDGRFFVIRSGDPETGSGAASNIVLVENWFEELKRLVPTN